MDEVTKAKIDAMTYQQLLEKWRFAPLGDPMFQGESGHYFEQRMKEKRSEVGDAGHIAASKAIGWDS